MMVVDVLVGDKWNIQRLKTLVSMEELEVIKLIHVSASRSEDKMA